jgi:hypothetical protein
MDILIVINRYMIYESGQDSSENKNNDSEPSVWKVGLIMTIGVRGEGSLQEYSRIQG